MSNLINCPDCNKEISANAKICPSCGTDVAKALKKKKPFYARHPIISVIFGLWIIGSIVSVFTPTPPQPASNNVATSGNKVYVPKTPEQKALRAKLEAEYAAKAEQEKRDKALREEWTARAFNALVLIKKNMLEPESFSPLSVFIPSDKGGLCVKYKGKNGFGGYSANSFVISPDGKVKDENQGNDFIKLWNNTCAEKSGWDITEEVEYNSNMFSSL